MPSVTKCGDIIVLLPLLSLETFQWLIAVQLTVLPRTAFQW